jgi:23S rRNA (uracil1939-C5)-methyltransferase
MNITIDHVNWRGDGVGEGQTFRNVLASEVVDAATGKVIKPSPERIEAFCKYFEKCGGCQLQHWKLEPYQRWKQNLIMAALAKRGIEATVGKFIDAHGAG